jgi:hypothetical protein
MGAFRAGASTSTPYIVSSQSYDASFQTGSGAFYAMKHQVRESFGMVDPCHLRLGHTAIPTFKPQPPNGAYPPPRMASPKEDPRMPRPERVNDLIRPTLRTLGALHLEGAPLQRPKPLLLLAFLSCEGPKDRDHLARWFFADCDDARDALTTTLRRLGPLVGAVSAWDDRLRSRVASDVLAFERDALSEYPEVALRRYHGAFLQGLQVTCSVEVEDWIFATRERLGSLARDLHGQVARFELGSGRLDAAWDHAKSVMGLTEDLGLDPEPAARLLQTFKGHGLSVPDGWWRALTAFEFDRRTSGAAVVDAVGSGEPKRDLSTLLSPERLHARSERMLAYARKRDRADER